MTAPRVLISHATADAQFANRLAEDLRSAGADVWLDSSHMGAGDFVARINNALLSRDVVVLVLSPAAIQSNWVSQEFNAAIARTQQGFMRPPIVIVSRPCKLSDIPPLQTVYHRYDASNDYSAAMHGVARELGLGAPTSAPSVPYSGAPFKPAQGVGHIKIAIAGGITMALNLIAFGFGLDKAPYSVLLTLLSLVAWAAALRVMIGLKRWGWVASLVLGGVGALFFAVLATYVGTYVTMFVWLAIFPCAFTLTIGLFGPTSQRDGT